MPHHSMDPTRLARVLGVSVEVAEALDWDSILKDGRALLPEPKATAPSYLLLQDDPTEVF